MEKATKERNLNVGDKVRLKDADTFVLPTINLNTATEKEQRVFNETYKESIEAQKKGKIGYEILEITPTHVHCRNDVIPKFSASRNMFYGKNDLHLIMKEGE